MVSELRASECSDSEGSSLESGSTGDQVVFVTEFGAGIPLSGVGLGCIAIALGLFSPDLDSDSLLGIASGLRGKGLIVNYLLEVINHTLLFFDGLSSLACCQRSLQVLTESSSVCFLGSFFSITR
jgi:hypothetical protein